VWGVAFEKAVRRKPLARRTRDLCKLNGGSGGCRSWGESSRLVGKEPTHLCQDESMAEVCQGGKRKTMSGGNGAHFGETLCSAPTVRYVGE